MNEKNELFRDFKGHLHIPVDDVDDEDLLQYFPAANTFISEALEDGGGVLVHWLAPFPRFLTESSWDHIPLLLDFFEKLVMNILRHYSLHAPRYILIPVPPVLPKTMLDPYDDMRRL